MGVGPLSAPLSAARLPVCSERWPQLPASGRGHCRTIVAAIAVKQAQLAAHLHPQYLTEVVGRTFFQLQFVRVGQLLFNG